MAEPTPASYADLLERIRSHVRTATAYPFLLGVAGPPASGKSTLALRLVDDLRLAHGLEAKYCPMDGFHLPNARLDALRLRAAKGRIDTFDAGALLAATRRLTAKDAFWWPAYSRTRHDPVGEGVRITGLEKVCVLEGNYLLCDAPVWRDVARLFGLRVYIDVPDEVLRVRLLARHRAGGRDIDEARAKIARTDLPNARRIRSGKSAAEIVIDDARRLRLDEKLACR